ncbi:MAG: hypothetical protein HYX46_03055 [Betaproteobacteria bacterium]|nr:hypothetical protein [Betaproteobacteria bacterium]
MNEERRISAEMRNAFVDGQLDASEWEHVAARIEDDPGLREDVDALRAVKEMVRHAYADPPKVSRRGSGHPHQGWRWLAAASVAFAAAGWFGHEWWSGVPELDPASAYMLRGQAVAFDRDRVLVHVSNGDRETLSRALDEVEDLLRAARKQGRGLEIEVIANRSGLELLKANDSRFAARVTALRAEYGNLRFIACGQTLRRLDAAGHPVELLPGTEVAPSALDQVVKRLQGGWVYVRV